MAIHWKIPFKSLRTGTVYTVNIYDSSYSGDAVELKGAAQPFQTQEDGDDDMFKPVRTQSGYIRFVDDGKDASGNTLSSGDDWKALLPLTDTDRPVTLTHVSGSSTIVDWCGFMQPQDFGSALYGNPQERSFPIQCPLTVTECTDINYQQPMMQNFAYLLKQVVDSIPQTCRPTHVVVQGGSDAQGLLLKLTDWQNLVVQDAADNPSPRYNMFSCLEDLCRFFGWTARMYGKKLYLVCADDTQASSFLTMTYAQLGTMASGSAAGTTTGTFSSVSLTGDIFASTRNEDFVQRGPNTAIVSADANQPSEALIEAWPGGLVKAMYDQGISATTGGSFGHGGNATATVKYTNDMLTIDTAFLGGSARSGYASFNVMTVRNGGNPTESYNVIRIKKSYSSGSTTPHATLQTVYHHCYSKCYIILSGTIYRQGARFKDADEGIDAGRKKMYLRVGVGLTRETAMWYNPNVNNSWTSEMSEFSVPIGQESELLANLTTLDSAYGLLFVDFLGSDDLDAISGERSFELADFTVEIERNPIYKYVPADSHFGRYKTRDLRTKVEYRSTNVSNVRMEFRSDCIFASDNDMVFGYGVLMNPDGTPFNGFAYNGGSLLVHPEQHLADRVTSYWATSKRRLELELRVNTIGEITPQAMVSIDSTTGYPISISREWRDDVLKCTILQL